MPDLYAELGVERTADKAEMRRAYRRKAKSAHPDAGGSAQAFQRLKTALAVLSDDARRQRYDQTGEVSEDQPIDTELARRLEILSLVLDMALGTIIEAKRDPASTDVLSAMVNAAAMLRQKWSEEAQGLTRAEKTFGSVEGRFSIRKGEEPNRIEQLIAGQRSQLRHRIAITERRIASLDEVRAMLDNYTYRRDAAPMQQGPTTISLQDLLGGMGMGLR